MLASLLIHFAALVGFEIPVAEYLERSEGSPIAARIALQAPAEKSAAPALPVRSKRKSTRSLPNSAVPPAQLPAEPAASAQTMPAETATVPEEIATAPKEVPARAEQAPPEAAVRAEAAEPSIVFPELIELEFDIAKDANEAPLGRVVHRFERDGPRYSIRSVTAAVGIAALFTSARYVQESRGKLTPRGLQPDQFVVRRGRIERTESAAFDWATSRVTLTAGGAIKESLLQAGAQDQLSYLHQLSFLIVDPSLAAVQVTNGRRFFLTTLEILGWENVNTGLGPTNTLHVRAQLEGESRVEYWLAPDYAHLPVKVRFRDKRGEGFEQVLTAMKVK